jgi:hypothetical protein
MGAWSPPATFRSGKKALLVRLSDHSAFADGEVRTAVPGLGRYSLVSRPLG